MANETEFSFNTLGRQEACRRFPFWEIQSATQNFDESLAIGHGGFGKVYKGIIIISGSHTVVAAIKRLDSTSNQGADEFWAEVEMLSKLRHCHLVSLIGYCNDGQEMILVYEYMPQGTLEDHLHKLHTPLSWVQRLKICIGAARGLDYLHTGTGIDHGVIHRDVKSSNILLHESWAAKISDFGLSKIGPTNQPSTYVNTLVKGTFGYLDPDYFSSGRLTRKSDVYAFGVVLLEVLCGKRAVDKSLDEEQWGLVGWAQDYIIKGKIKQIIDPNLKGQISPKCLNRFAKIADQCLHSRPKQRPTMAEVVASLESVLSLQEKTSSSIHPMGMTIFGRKVPMFLFPSNGKNSAHEDAKLPSNSKGNNKNHILVGDEDVFLNNGRDVPMDHKNPKPILKVSKIAHVGQITGHLNPDARDIAPPLGVSLNLSSLGETFTYQEILTATSYFGDANFLKHGHSADLFRGVLEGGIPVVIKRFDVSSQKDSYILQLDFFSKVSHPRLVPLLGHCLENENEKFLVYRYMPNGDLSNSWYRKIDSDDDSLISLDWITRLKIAMGAAEGLSYLHHELTPPVVHRDVQASSILLDDAYEVRVGSLNEVYTQEGDGHPNKITRTSKQGASGAATCAYDVFCFGKVLLELVTGEMGMSAVTDSTSKDWLERTLPHISIYDKELVTSIVDPSLIVDEDFLMEIWAMAIVAKSCLNPKPSKRPLMKYVLKALENPLELVREENRSSAKLQTTSSEDSWKAAIVEWLAEQFV